MAYKRRLCPKGIPFSWLQVYKMSEISQVEVYERVYREICHLVVLKGL